MVFANIGVFVVLVIVFRFVFDVSGISIVFVVSFLAFTDFVDFVDFVDVTDFVTFVALVAFVDFDAFANFVASWVSFLDLFVLVEVVSFLVFDVFDVDVVTLSFVFAVFDVDDFEVVDFLSVIFDTETFFAGLFVVFDFVVPTDLTAFVLLILLFELLLFATISTFLFLLFDDVFLFCVLPPTGTAFFLFCFWRYSFNCSALSKYSVNFLLIGSFNLSFFSSIKILWFLFVIIIIINIYNNIFLC